MHIYIYIVYLYIYIYTYVYVCYCCHTDPTQTLQELYIYIHIESGETSGEIAKQMMDDAGPNVYLKSKPMKIVKSPSSSYA